MLHWNIRLRAKVYLISKELEEGHLDCSDQTPEAGRTVKISEKQGSFLTLKGMHLARRKLHLKGQGWTAKEGEVDCINLVGT